MRWMGHMHGDQRVITRFLFFPLKVNGEWRWLEKVRIPQSWGTVSNGWINDWFEDEEDK